MTEKIAVIGMGQMGSGMARRFASQGRDVVGYDINTQTRQALAKDGMAMADSATEAALAGRSLILTSLPDPAAIRAAWLGDGGLVETAAKGSLILDLSTIDPADHARGGRGSRQGASTCSIVRSPAVPLEAASGTSC